METRSKVSRKASEKEPLPGERQGMAGAGDGHDSERDASGVELSRRAHIDEEVTAEMEVGTQYHTAHAAGSVAQVIEPAPTQAGRMGKRRKWSRDMNEDILRTYFRVTDLGENQTGYRQRLHSEFLKLYPDLSLTEQRVADQYRVILRNNLIPETRIGKIREEIRREKEDEQMKGGESREDLEGSGMRLSISISESVAAEVQQQNICMKEINELKYEMKRAIVKYSGLDAACRPAIPKVNTSRKLGKILNVMNNNVLPEHINASRDIEEFHSLIYCGAVTVVHAMGIELREYSHRGKAKSSMPQWEKRLVRRVEKLREDIARLEEYIRGVRSSKLNWHVEHILKNQELHTKYDAPNKTARDCSDTLKQKLSVLADRLAKYRKSRKRREENALFSTSEKKFYRQLGGSKCAVNDGYPTKEQIKEFWGNQLTIPAHFNSESHWLKGYQQELLIEEMQYEEFSAENVTEVIKGLANWKSPGPDHIQNFWYKKFQCTHARLSEFLNNMISNPVDMPDFLMRGVTYLIPKDPQDTSDPRKYRPITCLPTLYKIITSCLAKRIQVHCKENNIVSIEQKGCEKGSRGCKEQLVIDSVVSRQAYSKSRNIFMAFVDYAKAFDSVPHDWLQAILEVYKIHPKYINFLKRVMSVWQTSLCLHTLDERIVTEPMRIRRGIFQGDSLSPLWFILAMNPLSKLLNSTQYGFSIKTGKRIGARLSHLLYMDDLKIYAETQVAMEHLLRIVEMFSQDICMNLGVDKCQILKVVKGKLQEGNYALEDGQHMKALSSGETYKYLGFKQCRSIDHSEIKKDLSTEFCKRLRRILKTSLNSRNLVKAVNSYAVPVLGYSFGIIKWSKTDINELERKLRTMLTKERKHHPKSAMERMTLPRHMGGRGFADINRQMENQIKDLRKYFHDKANVSQLHKAVVSADEFTPLALKKEQVEYSSVNYDQMILTWKNKPLHGRHPNEMSRANVDMSASNFWLTSGQIFPETEGYMFAIQDQVLPTRNYLKYIVGDQSVENDKCRYGCPESETIQHITSACRNMLGTEYKSRHDAVAKILHQEIAQDLQLLDKKEKIPYFQYQPESVLENQDYRLYWDRTVLTDATVQHNRPDIVILDKKKKDIKLVEISIPNSHNLERKFSEKLNKYNELMEPIKRQWKMDTVRTIPVLISTTGLVPKSLLSALRELEVNTNIYKLMQKSVILATTRIVRKFMNNNT